MAFGACRSHTKEQTPMPKSTASRLVSISDASRQTGIPYATILSWCRTGKLKFTRSKGKSGKPKTRIKAGDLNAFLKRLTISQPSPLRRG
jgi:excisionase family DNA binding protein